MLLPLLLLLLLPLLLSLLLLLLPLLLLLLLPLLLPQLLPKILLPRRRYRLFSLAPCSSVQQGGTLAPGNTSCRQLPCTVEVDAQISKLTRAVSKRTDLRFLTERAEILAHHACATLMLHSLKLLKVAVEALSRVLWARSNMGVRILATVGQAIGAEASATAAALQGEASFKVNECLGAACACQCEDALNDVVSDPPSGLVAGGCRGDASMLTCSLILEPLLEVALELRDDTLFCDSLLGPGVHCVGCLWKVARETAVCEGGSRASRFGAAHASALAKTPDVFVGRLFVGVGRQAIGAAEVAIASCCRALHAFSKVKLGVADEACALVGGLLLPLPRLAQLVAPTKQNQLIARLGELPLFHCWLTLLALQTHKRLQR